MTEDHSKNLWTAEDTATYLRLKSKTIYELVSSKKIPYIKIGRSVRFNPDKILSWLESKSVASLGGRR